jgi:hypothetical protein
MKCGEQCRQIILQSTKSHWNATPCTFYRVL